MEELVKSGVFEHGERQDRGWALRRRFYSEANCEQNGLRQAYSLIAGLPSKYSMSNNGHLEFELRERARELSDLEDRTEKVLQLLWDQYY